LKAFISKSVGLKEEIKSPMRKHIFKIEVRLNKESVMNLEKNQEVFKHKESINPQRLGQLLRLWADAIEANEDLRFSIKNEEVVIPKETFNLAKIVAEYELKDGEYEFEIEMKWKNDFGENLRKPEFKREDQERYL
jgi:amphi-Trp domain-containing protein